MDKRDVEEFIEEMEEIGDVWQEEDVASLWRIHSSRGIG